MDECVDIALVISGWTCVILFGITLLVGLLPPKMDGKIADVLLLLTGIAGVIFAIFGIIS